MNILQPVCNVESVRRCSDSKTRCYGNPQTRHWDASRMRCCHSPTI